MRKERSIDVSNTLRTTMAGREFKTKFVAFHYASELLIPFYIDIYTANKK